MGMFALTGIGSGILWQFLKNLMTSVGPILGNFCKTKKAIVSICMYDLFLCPMITTFCRFYFTFSCTCFQKV